MVLKIVTSIYELNYEKNRGGMVYKSFPLLTQTIRNIIFDEYEYVIYTDKKTYEKHNLQLYFNKPNITIKFHELNSEFYVNQVNNLRKSKFDSGEIYDRIYCVENYIEVILNKIKFLLKESVEDKNTIWIDSGLFGTSCHDSWRDYVNEFAHSKYFLDKINEKIENNKFICLRGNGIVVNYELKDKIRNLFNVDIKLVPGGLFGGKNKEIHETLSEYQTIFEKYISHYKELISEQEVLSILTNNKNIKNFDFNDWNDLQRGILKIMDYYEEDKYKIDKTYNVGL